MRESVCVCVPGGVHGKTSAKAASSWEGRGGGTRGGFSSQEGGVFKYTLLILPMVLSADHRAQTDGGCCRVWYPSNVCAPQTPATPRTSGGPVVRGWSSLLLWSPWCLRASDGSPSHDFSTSFAFWLEKPQRIIINGKTTNNHKYVRQGM